AAKSNTTAHSFGHQRWRPPAGRHTQGRAMSPALDLAVLLFSLFVRGSLSQADGDPFCQGLSPDDRVVSTADEATALAADLDRCPGREFNVYWIESIELSQPFQLSNATTLRVTGESKETSVADGAGKSTLFEVSDLSTLYLEALALTGGYGEDGGAVAIRSGAVVTLEDCAVYGNTATSNGGAIFLDGESSFVAGGVNFTNNGAEVYGGAIHAQDRSTVTTQDATVNIFQGNSARLGGAIHAQDSSDITFGSGGDVTLSGNSALFRGGAVNLEHGSLIKTDGVTSFTGNQAGNNGGGVWAFNGSEVVITGNTSFLDNTSQNYGGAVMLTEDSTARIRGNTNFTNNFALYDGGAIQAEFGGRVQIAGQTMFLNNTVGNFGGAMNAFDGVTVTAVGETSFIGNTAEEGGAIYADRGVIVALAGAQLYENNSARSYGGAIHFSSAPFVMVTGQSKFDRNEVLAGSGGAIMCSGVPKATFKNANFTRNIASWGGAVAAASSGGSLTSSDDNSAVGLSDFWTSGSGYDPNDLTPSLTADSSTVTSFVPAFVTSDWLSISSSDVDDYGSGSAPVKFLDCGFEDNFASEDGGAMYSVAGYDMIQGSRFVNNKAASSGGALVHAGLVEEISDTLFEGNSAGNEGPAVLSLGLLSYMGGVTFDDNVFYCEEGKFGTETAASTASSAGDATGRFDIVCSRCSSECECELEEGASVVDEDSVPTCEVVPEGSQTTTRGNTVETLEILPGFYRSSETSLDIRECFHEQACAGGEIVGEYCSEGYSGPYCAVCTAGYSPGYAHTCKSCLGDSKRRALGIIASIATVALVALAFLVAKLVSVVETGPPVKAQSRWQQKCSVWQQRMRNTVPLTAVKIVVVVWQIVTQYSDVAGVQYPGAYNDFLSVIDMVNLDLGFIISFACVYDTNFYDRLLMATICPMVVMGLLGCTYLVARRRNGHSEEAIGVVKRRHLSVALFVMFFVYATVSYTVFETFVCDELDDGSSYLRADYSLTCWTSLHTGYQVYAGLMVLVYPVGVPCVFGWWLFKYRRELTEDNRGTNADLRPLADLWEPYKQDKYYYEVVECFRRIALTGLAVFILPESSAQIAVVLLLSVVFMVVSEILSPFARPVEMWLYRAGHYVVFASMYLALLLRVDVSDENDQSQEVFSGVIVIAHAAMLLVVVAQGLLIFVGWGDLVEAPGALADLNSETMGLSERDPFAENGGGWNARRRRAGGESKRTSPRNIKAGFGIDGHGVDGVGPADFEKDKKWETWERPLPTAKHSFFQSPSPSGQPVVPGIKSVSGKSIGSGSDDDYAGVYLSEPPPTAKANAVPASCSWATSTSGGGDAALAAFSRRTVAKKVRPGEEDSDGEPEKGEKEPARAASLTEKSRGGDAAVAGRDPPAKKQLFSAGARYDAVGRESDGRAAAARASAGAGTAGRNQNADGDEEGPARAAVVRDKSRINTKRSLSTESGGGRRSSGVPQRTSWSSSVGTAEYNSGRCSRAATSAGAGGGGGATMTIGTAPPGVDDSAESVSRTIWTPRGKTSVTEGSKVAPADGSKTPVAAPAAAAAAAATVNTQNAKKTSRARQDNSAPAADAPRQTERPRKQEPQASDDKLAHAGSHLSMETGGGGGGGISGGGSIWATAPRSAPYPSTSVATGFAHDQVGAAAGGTSENKQRTFVSSQGARPDSHRPRPNARVVLSPASSTLSMASSVQTGGSTRTLAPPANRDGLLSAKIAALAESLSSGGTGAPEGLGSGRGGSREAVVPGRRPQFSTAGLFGKAGKIDEQEASAAPSSNPVREPPKAAAAAAAAAGPRRIPGPVGAGREAAGVLGEGRASKFSAVGKLKLFPEGERVGKFAKLAPVSKVGAESVRGGAGDGKRSAGARHGGRSGGRKPGDGDVAVLPEIAVAPPFTRDFRSLSGSSVGG
ncbi:unnamed protein product, partial [Scytosiphon promiscuus]